MHRVFHVLFIIFALSFVSNSRGFENASRNPWTTSKDRTTVVSHRRSRSTSRPEPINCKLMGWSLWSPCNSCTDKKFRFRYMEQPSQFGGSECVESLWDKLTCPTSTAQCLEADYCGDSFTCRESGRCISQSLRCNDEQDCSDGSDEEGCAQVTSRNDKCSTLQPIPGAPRGTQGFNVLTGDFVDQVLDYRYYGGLCEYVYNGEWRRMTYDAFCEKLGYDDEEKNYRKPFNYHTYHFVAEATSEGSQEYYSDMLSLVKARKTENSFNLGITVAVENFEIGARGSEESTISKRLTQSNKQDLGFVRLRSKVQTARFKMRSDGLMLHEDMYMSLMELPESYNFGMYSRFLNTFGTHYVTEGLMGGTLEYILVVNKTSMERSSVTGEQFGSCIGGSIGLPIPFKGGELDLKLSGDTCRKESDYLNDQKSGSNFIEDIYTLVKGGVTHNAGVLLTIRDPESYKKWGASLKYNPVLIQYETMPIYELVRASTAAGQVGERLSHLRRAWDEYLLQFHSCRCAPCRHGGVPFLAGTSCKCLCKEGYYGQACEETLRNSASPNFHSIFSFLIPTQTPRTDGAWSCWGAWSSCWSGSKTRTRACTNPSPDGGGAPCLGSDSQRRNC